MIAARLMLNGQPDLHLASFYRPPSGTLEGIHILRRELDKISSNNNTNLIIGGEFNVPDIDWSRNEVKENPQYGMELNNRMLDTINDLFLTHVVTEPTRGDNILDLIFTSNLDQLTNVHTSPGMSDYEALIGTHTGKLKLNQKPARKIYMYSKANRETITKEIGKLRDKIILRQDNTNANEKWTLFRNGLGNSRKAHTIQDGQEQKLTSIHK